MFPQGVPPPTVQRPSAQPESMPVPLSPAGPQHLQNHTEPAYRQHPSCPLSGLQGSICLPWVCLLLKHNPEPMEMTGSNTGQPTQPIPVNRAVAVAAICQEHPTARGSPHPTSTRQNQSLKCHIGKHNLWHSPGPQGSSFDLIQFWLGRERTSLPTSPQYFKYMGHEVVLFLS